MADDAPTPGGGPPAVDPAQAAYLHARLLSEQNLLGAVLSGLAASLAGAGLWASLTVLTGYQIGFMAIGVGVLVGYAVRTVGRGVTPAFGVLGAALALLGCAAGNLLAVTAMVAGHEGLPLLDALSRLTPDVARQLMVATFSGMDLLFYGVALYEGYRLSFRRVGPGEVAAMVTGTPAS